MTINIYEKMYKEEKNLGKLKNNPRILEMLKIINMLDLKNKNILDIGCHDGAFLSLIKNRKNNFYGLEANDWAVGEAQKKGVNVQKYFFDDISKLPFENNFFDLVIAGEIIEHIFDTDFFMGEIKRILKPGGRLLLSTPNLASFGRRSMLFFGISPHIEISPNEEGSCGHIHYFTFKTTKKILEKSGFLTIKLASDTINFSNNGKLRSEFLAKIFKTLGASIIVLARNKK